MLTSAHPKTLRVFFATEMWERYGFYVVQSLLALYLALHFRWPDKQVYALVGSFTALTFSSPIIGGWIADHLIGQKRAVLTGAMVLLMSYLGLSLAAENKALCLALAGIAVGTGLLKPNVSSLLGNVYADDSPHRESGFTIFYMGITTGIIMGTTLPSYLSTHLGWSAPFISAAVGMIIAALVFLYGICRYPIFDYHPYQFSWSKIGLAFLIMSGLWVLCFYILRLPKLADSVFLMIVLMSFVYLCYCVKHESTTQSKQTMVIGLLCLVSVLFFAFYFQMFLSLTLFIVRVVQPTLFGLLFPAPYYVAAQSIGMIGFGLLLSRRKNHLDLLRQGVSTGNKFLTSMLFMTFAYGIITFACHQGFSPNLLAPLCLIPAYLVISLAELLISPVGLSAVTVLASRKNVSTMMGLFFVSLGLGGFFSGKLAFITVIPVGIAGLEDLKAHYFRSFGLLFLILCFLTLGCFFINILIKKLLKPSETNFSPTIV